MALRLTQVVKQTFNELWNKLSSFHAPGLNGLDLYSYVQNETTEAIQLYVETTGDDNSDDGSQQFPFATVQATLNSLPKRIRHPVRIDIGLGTFPGYNPAGFDFLAAESVSAGGYIAIYGSWKSPTLTSGTESGTATSGTAGSSTTFGTLVDSTQSWTTNELEGLQLEITSGTGSGQIVTIASNTSTTITVVGVWTAPTGTSTYSIRDYGTTISPAINLPASATTAASVTAGSAVLVHTNNAFVGNDYIQIFRQNLAGAATSISVRGGGGVGVMNCKLSSTGTPRINVANTAQLRVRNCYSSHTGSAFHMIVGGTDNFASGTVFNSFFRGGGTGIRLFNSCAGVISGCQYTDVTVAIELSGAAGFPQCAGVRVDGNNKSGSIGVRAAGSATQTYVPALTMNGMDISNCASAAVSLTNLCQLGASALTGTGNAIGLSLNKGARIQVSSSSTITGTTEVSIDGTTSTLATMRAASPKLIKTDYGTIFYE